MTIRQPPAKFLVAFSFAGDERELVRKIAEEIEKELGAPNVFFDEWFEHYIAGHDADLKLQQVYGERSELVVVCISERYGGKPWTQAEHEAIRARVMQDRVRENEYSDLAVLPIRVGDGEVKGITFNTIAPDVRERSIVESAELIVARLGLIRQDLSKKASTVQSDWLEQPPPLRWPVANHSEVRVAFEQLLIRKSPWQFLPLRGPSESGKSYITRQMLVNALQIPNLACGRFDFKGTTDMDTELRSFVQYLDVPMPPIAPRLNESLSNILDSLKQRGQPALLIFDTYEAAGEAEEWVERQLLPSLIRSTWLRAVIAGQRVPKSTGVIWQTIACPLTSLGTPPPDDWLEFGKQYNPNLSLDLVEQVCQLTGATSTLLAQLLGPKA